MSFTTAALLVAWVAIAVLALGYAGLMRQLAELQRAAVPQGGRPGSLAPVLTGLALPGEGDLAALRPAGGGFVVFVAPGCHSCDAALGEAAARSLGPRLVVASSGPCPDRLPPGLEDARCLGQSTALMQRLGVPGTPYLVQVDADGVIGRTALPRDVEDVRAFLGGLPVSEHRHGHGGH